MFFLETKQTNKQNLYSSQAILTGALSPGITLRNSRPDQEHQVPFKALDSAQRPQRGSFSVFFSSQFIVCPEWGPLGTKCTTAHGAAVRMRNQGKWTTPCFCCYCKLPAKEEKGQNISLDYKSPVLLLFFSLPLDSLPCPPCIGLLLSISQSFCHF